MFRVPSRWTKAWTIEFGFRLLDGNRHDGVFDLLCDAVFQHRLLAADLLQRQLAAFVVKLLEAVKAVAAITHHLAGLAHVAKLLGKLQEPDLGADDLLFGGHGVLPFAEAGRCAPPTARAPPRLPLCEGA